MSLNDALVKPCEPIVFSSTIPIDSKRSLRLKKPLVFQPCVDLEYGGLSVDVPPLFIALGEDRDDLIQELQNRIVDSWLLYGNNPNGDVGTDARKFRKRLHRLMEEIPNATRQDKSYQRLGR